MHKIHLIACCFIIQTSMTPALYAMKSPAQIKLSTGILQLKFFEKNETEYNKLALEITLNPRKSPLFKKNTTPSSPGSPRESAIIFPEKQFENQKTDDLHFLSAVVLGSIPNINKHIGSNGSVNKILKVYDKYTKWTRYVTALYCSIDTGKPKITILLLEAGADPEGTIYGRPLRSAIIWQNKKIIKMLLEAGANPWSKNTAGNSAMNTGTSVEVAKLLACYAKKFKSKYEIDEDRATLSNLPDISLQ